MDENNMPNKKKLSVLILSVNPYPIMGHTKTITLLHTGLKTKHNALIL
jgi:hypothetical protein